MITKSHFGKSIKYFANPLGKPSPNKTTSGFTTPEHLSHVGICSLNTEFFIYSNEKLSLQFKQVPDLYLLKCYGLLKKKIKKF